MNFIGENEKDFITHFDIKNDNIIITYADGHIAKFVYQEEILKQTEEILLEQIYYKMDFFKTGYFSTQINYLNETVRKNILLSTLWTVPFLCNSINLFIQHNPLYIISIIFNVLLINNYGRIAFQTTQEIKKINYIKSLCLIAENQDILNHYIFNKDTRIPSINEQILENVSDETKEKIKQLIGSKTVFDLNYHDNYPYQDLQTIITNIQTFYPEKDLKKINIENKTKSYQKLK